MFMKKFIYFCLALSLFAFSNTVMAATKSNLDLSQLSPITFYTEIFPPANYMNNNELVGITVDSLKLIWTELKLPEQDITVLPWTRAYRNTLKTSNTALFTMAKTPAREPLFKWVGPLFKSVHILMAKKSSNLKFTNLADVLNYKVSAIKGDISEISLRQVGFPDFNIAKVDDLERSFIMLQSGRVEMMVVSIHSFQHLTNRLGIDASQYEQVWKVNEIDNYIAFNLDTSDDVIQAYQTALDKLESQRTLIKQSYILPAIEY
jgi:polar amino acid transport system substrate-binding protein